MLLVLTPSSERLRKPELNLSLMQTVNCRRRHRIQILRNQNLGRIQQIAIIYCQRASQRRPEPKAHAHGVAPSNAQILCVNILNEIPSRRNRLRMKEVADAAKYIATIIKRNDLNVGR